MKTPSSITVPLTLLVFAFATRGPAQPAQQIAPQPGGAPPQLQASSPQDYPIIERGPNHALRERIVYEPSPSGKLVPRPQRIMELASGLHFLDPETGQWTESDDSFQITPEGYAVAARCQHKLIVSPSLDDANGVLDCLSPDGARIRTALIGILLFDPASGKTLQVAAVKPCPGVQTATNEITFPDAFQGLKASVRIRNERGRYHQEVLLNEKLTPAQISRLGFSPDSVRMEIWTEFLESPTPAVQSVVLNSVADPARRAAMVDPDTVDDSLDFDALKMARGVAFLEGQPGKSATVFKRWLEDSGRRFLIEACNYAELQPLLQALPESTLAGYTPKPAGKGLLAGLTPRSGSSARLVSGKSRRTPPERFVSSSHPSYSIAKLDPARNTTPIPQVNWDYTMLSGIVTGYCFQGNFTYYISGNVTLWGTNTWEGGSVIKFARNVALNITPGAYTPKTVFTSAAYKPVIFTAVDDSSVGENIGSGNPTGYYASSALAFAGVAPLVPELPYVRFAYAKVGLSLGAVSANVSHAQFINCQQGISAGGSTLHLGNVLFANTITNFALGGGVTATAENVSFSGSSYLTTGPGTYGGNVLAFTNCILANVSNLSDSGWTPGGDYNGFYNSPNFGSTVFSSSSWPFQTAGAASFYLAPGSPFRSVGATNIDSSLLVELRKSTTFPPIVYSNVAISADTTFTPQAQRETGQLDLGYAYPALDYIFGAVNANANLTFPAGTAVGWFFASTDHGVHIVDGHTATFSGTASAPCYWVRRNTVQEGTSGVADGSQTAGITGSAWPDFSLAPVVSMRFTRCSILACETTHMRDDWGYLIVHARDCEFWGGGCNGYCSQLNYTNCLFDRVSAWTSWDGAPTTNCSFILQSCLLRGGGLNPARTGSDSYGNYPLWSIHDTAFDATTIGFNDAASGNSRWTKFDYNAYLIGSNTTSPSGLHDLAVTNFNWQTSWLGSYYLPTNSSLINTGSVTADVVGLYHYTTQTNQIKETNSIVDISYHYVAVDGNGNPLDYDGDGMSDYLEDANGNGTFDSGETDWKTYNSPNGLTTGNGLQVFTPLRSPAP